MGNAISARPPANRELCCERDQRIVEIGFQNGAPPAGGAGEEVALELVQVGDRLRVRPGDAVPVAGKVLEGKGSMVTGESMPAAKKSGDKQIGGTVNGTGSLIMRADKVGADTMLARIVTMVGETQRSSAARRRFSGWRLPSRAISLRPFLEWPSWPSPYERHSTVGVIDWNPGVGPWALR